MQTLKLLSDPIDDLTRLANQAGSDKGDMNLSRHCYTRVYGELFASLRSEPIRLLEIGLLHIQDPDWKRPSLRNAGGQLASHAPSLKMWADYFPNAEIFGFDINDFSAVSLERVRTIQGDMADRADLQRLVDLTGGNFDVVIDDASHASHHQQIALSALLPHVKPGGYYIVEDLRFQPLELERSDAIKTRDVLRRGVSTGDYQTTCIGSEESEYLRKWIQSIEFFDSLSLASALTRNDSLAVIQKRA
ncbi:MAG: hypothetical protein KF769_13900 [Parvibaculum sp.]|nr:hypothetical protein [Parvibaculum sp.]